jgi:DNA-binding CsgD family transcriptional regulator
MSAGPPPDRFLVGLAVLSLLSAATDDEPLIGVVDDAQWLDHASAQALGFAARRLAADPVGLVFVSRVPGDEAEGLPRLEVGGLRDADARALLGTAPRPPHTPRAPDLLLDGMAAHYNQGYTAALPILRDALAAFANGTPADDELRWLHLACNAAAQTWDDGRWDQLSTQFLDLARGAGLLSELPLALHMRAFVALLGGDLASAGEMTDELRAVAEATGAVGPPYVPLMLAALRGDVSTPATIEAATRDATRRGEGLVLSTAGWARAILGNGRGQWENALAGARLATSYAGNAIVANLASIELIEAAARSGENDAAADGLSALAAVTTAGGTDWALGVEARSRALLSDGDDAERLYQEAIARLGRTRLRPDLARAHLLYGEWLRRQRRRTEARDELRTAHEMLEAMGMEAFADRARHELQATGETPRKRTEVASDRQLTAQETQVARLARDGLSNPEIGARLFISARTVQYHLGKVFAKLDISSRGELHRVLAGDGSSHPAS